MASKLNAAQFPISQRDAFLIPSGPGNHIFFVLTDPAKHTHVILVNATTCYPGAPHDSTCYLGASDHQFFQHQSYIFYGGARVMEQQRLRRLIAAQEIIYRPPPLNATSFARVLNGISSPEMEEAKRRFVSLYK